MTDCVRVEQSSKEAEQETEPESSTHTERTSVYTTRQTSLVQCVGSIQKRVTVRNGCGT